MRAACHSLYTTLHCATGTARRRGTRTGGPAGMSGAPFTILHFFIFFAYTRPQHPTIREIQLYEVRLEESSQRRDVSHSRNRRDAHPRPSALLVCPPPCTSSADTRCGGLHQHTLSHASDGARAGDGCLSLLSPVQYPTAAPEGKTRPDEPRTVSSWDLRIIDGVEDVGW